MHYLIFVILLQLCYWFCLVAKLVLCATNKYELKGLTIGFGPVIFQRKFGKAIISLRAFLLFGWLTIISVKNKQRNPIFPTAFSYLVCIIISVIIIGWPFSYDVSEAQLTTKVGYVADTVEQWNPLVEKREEVIGPAKKAGLLPGDEILRVDGAPVENFMDIQNRIVTGKGQTAQGSRQVYLTVLRDGQEMELEIYPEVDGPEEMRIIGIGPKETFFIGDLTPDMPAQKIGLEVGDQPVAIDGNIIHSFNQVVDYLETTEDNQSVAFTVRKGGENGTEKTYDLIPVEKELAYGTTVVTRKLIGFEPKFKIITTYPNPLTLIIRRVSDIKNTFMSSRSDDELRNMSGPLPSPLVLLFKYKPLKCFGFFLLIYPFLHATMLCLSLMIFLRRNPVAPGTIPDRAQDSATEPRQKEARPPTSRARTEPAAAVDAGRDRQILEIAKRAPLSCTLSIMCLIGIPLYAVIPGSFVLSSEDIFHPAQWYRFISYSILHLNVYHGVLNALLLFVIGYFLEKRIQRKFMATLIVSSVVAGGLIGCLLGYSVIGSGSVLEAYTGCLFACYFANKSDFSKLARILTVILLIIRACDSVIDLLFGLYGHFHIRNDIVLVLALIAGWKFYKRITINNGANQSILKQIKSKSKIVK